MVKFNWIGFRYDISYTEEGLVELHISSLEEEFEVSFQVFLHDLPDWARLLKVRKAFLSGSDTEFHVNVWKQIEAYEKIVERGRGGWCYEMNGLLNWALEEIGFEMKCVCGGVARTTRGNSALANHLVLIADDDNSPPRQ